MSTDRRNTLVMPKYASMLEKRDGIEVEKEESRKYYKRMG